MLNNISVSAKRAAGERRNGSVFVKNKPASELWTKVQNHNPFLNIMNHRKHSSQIFREAVRDFETRGRPCFYGVRAEY